MIEYLSQHPYVAAAMVLLILLTIFAWYKAIKASKRHNDERDRIVAELEKEKAIRKDFRHISELTFVEGSDNYRLIIGMCANVQMSIEKIADMEGAFYNLSDIKKNIYSFGYVFDDGNKKLSDFFRKNGEPLLSSAKNAIDEIAGGTKFAEIFDQEFTMLDDNDETVSVDDEKLEKLDNEYTDLMKEKSAEIYAIFASYIRKNKNEFLA